MEQFSSTMHGLMGQLTYDEALIKFGQPTSVTQGEEIFIASWSSEESGAVAIPIGNLVYAAPVSHGFVLQLTFGKISKLMQDWKYREW
jgi:hypothetical protein